MLHFDVDIGTIIANDDEIAMDVNEEPIHVKSSILMLSCTSPSSHSPEDGLHHTGILTFPCTIVDSRTDLYEEVGTDVEMWCNHGLIKKG